MLGIQLCFFHHVNISHISWKAPLLKHSLALGEIYYDSIASMKHITKEYNNVCHVDEISRLKIFTNPKSVKPVLNR